MTFHCCCLLHIMTFYTKEMMMLRHAKIMGNHEMPPVPSHTFVYVYCVKKKILLECLIILQHILNAAAVLFCCFLGLNGKQAPQLCISTTCSLAYSDGNEYALSRTPDMQYHHHMSLHSGMDTCTYYFVVHNTSMYSILLYVENTDRYIYVCMQGKLYSTLTIG